MQIPDTIRRRTIRSLPELVEEAQKVEDTLGGEPWYRGEPQLREKWSLVPSVKRPSAAPIGISIGRTEAEMMNDFRRLARGRYPDCPERDDYAGWLSLMQHHGLHTRLLDWTESPIIAAYFAVSHRSPAEPRGDSDAAIWVLFPSRLNVAHNIAGVPDLHDAAVRPLLEPAFDNHRFEQEAVCAVRPSEIDLRMMVQMGAFTVHSRHGAIPLYEEPGATDFLELWTVPAGDQDCVADGLRAAGVRRRNLFPDLGNLAHELNPKVPITRNLPGGRIVIGPCVDPDLR